jgi:hypothetical protein
MDDDHHDALVGHRKNGMDDLKMDANLVVNRDRRMNDLLDDRRTDVNRVNRNYVRHDPTLVVTMDDATGEHTSMFFCAQEGTDSSFHGLGQTIARYGLFASLYTDRGSHYFTTPEAGGIIASAASSSSSMG